MMVITCFLRKQMVIRLQEAVFKAKVLTQSKHIITYYKQSTFCSVLSINHSLEYYYEYIYND